ncbi:MAG: tetraacyldisaccharide 4'-kinase [Bacteroidia bacterium]
MPANSILRLLARAYGGVVAQRNRAYDNGHRTVFKAPVPVLATGNLSAGGTGKTPMAHYLLTYLVQQGRKPAYLSRGYGRRSRGYMLVPPGSRADLYGDEAIWIAQCFPALSVAVCEDRVQGIQHLLASGTTDTIVLDDAFQHRRAGRDLDLVLIDAQRPPTHDHLLPWGRLREPIESLHRADFLIINKIQDMQAAETIAQALQHLGKPIAFTRYLPLSLQDANGAVHPLNSLAGASVVVFSGIGNPGYFHASVQGTGASIQEKLTFGDHHRYQPHDLTAIAQAVHQHAPDFVLTTAKDLCRLDHAARQFLTKQIPLYCLDVQIEWLGGESLLQEQIGKILQQYPPKKN